MKLLIYSRTSTVIALKFGNGHVISHHTLLGMWLLIHAGIKVGLKGMYLIIYATIKPNPF